MKGGGGKEGKGLLPTIKTTVRKDQSPISDKNTVVQFHVGGGAEAEVK